MKKEEERSCEYWVLNVNTVTVMKKLGCEYWNPLRE